MSPQGVGQAQAAILRPKSKDGIVPLQEHPPALSEQNNPAFARDNAGVSAHVPPTRKSFP
ncbi:hypothetical protein GCM10009530_20810 [Microbispora corallina]|uniref:Uncharacterized protein n=1 Tax=Microbispora corallina TaxID=83302 RepID=A0ABQ4FTY1_9ACTN|nr:hypothetical protein Mco01_12590 [Microbispora corallina]